MNIVIIEDEQPARERLEGLLTDLIPECNIVAHLDNVKEVAKWFANNPAPNLVMLDVQLADGTAFDLLKLARIECPIIFTTAYSKYVLNAFKTTSIDYLLKPIKRAELEHALEKLAEFRQMFSKPDIVMPAKTIIPATPEYKKRFIIRFGEHIKTLGVENISYCSSENKTTFARSFDGGRFPMDFNLDSLEQMLDPHDFFRINRQFLISLKAIDEMKMFTKARVIVKLNPPVKEPPIVSSERAADFKLWLSGDFP